LPDVIYLRKSRADLELESRSEVDVLSRHEAELRRNADRLGRTVTEVYRKWSRRHHHRPAHDAAPALRGGDRQMGRRACGETSRLARGDTIDQGIVARAFQLSPAR
jgi:hypothetical protein